MRHTRDSVYRLHLLLNTVGLHLLPCLRIGLTSGLSVVRRLLLVVALRRRLLSIWNLPSIRSHLLVLSGGGSALLRCLSIPGHRRMTRTAWVTTSLSRWARSQLLPLDRRRCVRRMTRLRLPRVANARASVGAKRDLPISYSLALLCAAWWTLRCTLVLRSISIAWRLLLVWSRCRRRTRPISLLAHVGCAALILLVALFQHRVVSGLCYLELVVQ